VVLRRVLDNGVTVLVDRMADVRSFSLGFFVRAGSATEPASRQGLSHFLEHLLFKRTRRRSNAEIAQAIDRLGGDVDAFTTREYTGFYCRTLDARFSEALDLLGDVVLAPAFRAADVEVERGVILEEIGESNDNPEDLAHENFVRAFWKDHPLGAPILGTQRSVRAIRLDDLHRYYRSRYVPGQLVVAVAGHVREAEVLRSIERLLRRRTRGGRRRAPAPERPPRPHRHARIHQKPGLEQAHLCFGMGASSQASGRRYAGALFDTVLGGGMSSRLFQQVRERRGLVYTIGSALNSYWLGGYETISAACASKNLPRVVDVTLGELSKLKRGGVRPRELAWAKENLTGNLVLALESTVSRMSSAARQELYFRPMEPIEELIAKVEAVTLEQVNEEARRVLDGRALSVSVVGNVGRYAISASELAGAL
jgi:predicted Zn-dependent peptidase